MRRYIPELDGLRAMAILPVMVGHLGMYSHLPAIVAYGGTGVDLFFVISGFLITGILLDEKESDHYYRNFFARRGLRIWPLYYLVIATTALIARAPAPFGFHTDTWFGLITYTSNLSLHWPPWPVAVVWSLCIEEQFYLAWPVLIAICSRKTFSRLLIAILIVEPLLRWYLASNGVDSMVIYRNTFTRLDGLALGSLVAVVSNNGNFRYRRAAMILAFVTAGITVVSRFVPQSLRAASYYDFVAFAYGAVLCFTLSGTTLWARTLSFAPLVKIGRISYGLYLLHFPVYYGVAQMGIRPGLPLMIAQFAGAIVLAAISWKLFESPILRLKRHFHADVPSLRQVPAVSGTSTAAATATTSA